MAVYLRSYKPRYFDIKELVSKAMYKKRGHKAISLLDAHVLYSLDTLRAFLSDLTPDQPKRGSLTVNDWMWGGIYQARALRAPGDDSYSSTSKHAHGMAIDTQSKYYTAEELRNFILENRELFPYITCIEADVSWLHFDTRNLRDDAPEGAIMLVYPNGTFKYV